MGQPRGACIGAYAVVKLESSWRYELMDIEDLNRIKSRSPSFNSSKGPAGPWISDENEMRRKTIIKRILKMYCDDPAVVRALELDGGEFEDEPTAPATTQNRLNVPFTGGGLAEGEIAPTSKPNGLPAADDPQPGAKKDAGKLASKELIEEIGEKFSGCIHDAALASDKPEFCIQSSFLF